MMNDQLEVTNVPNFKVPSEPINGSCKPNKVAYYIVQTSESDFSKEAQISVLNKRCKREGHIVCKKYIDREIDGATMHEKPALQQLLSDAQQGQFDMVLVWKRNIISNKVFELIDFVEALATENIEFVSHKENFEASDIFTKLQFHALAAINEMKLPDIDEELLSGDLIKLKGGELIA
ncbi:recombinase family protein [Virgibacillus salinus]|uniref:Site-specific DNA recombinase n=1 Tax=Virgibacillus salinus TaxID=553311 RepID=A0A1H0XV80_9BACI|nr:recombinase family protein [Virgibacillus salinus]SDQ06818.1 site-specific DNA recombinase [Virgibacillus salinus]